jgi:hypothetical protein
MGRSILTAAGWNAGALAGTVAGVGPFTGGAVVGGLITFTSLAISTGNRPKTLP